MEALETLLNGMQALDASDLHLKVGVIPRYRVDGNLVEVRGSMPMTQELLVEMLDSTMDEMQKRRFEEEGVIHRSFGKQGVGRFRSCYYRDRSGTAAAFRRLTEQIPAFSSLGLPASIRSFAALRKGLVLVTGATGSGKSTTLASLIDIINSQERKFILTLEDPVEYVYQNKKSVIQQRGLHYDISDFGSGVRAAVDQNPDVLLVGELRDADSIRQVLAAAEMGMLVFATLHTNGAIETFDRIVDAVPADEQPQIRAMLSQSLAGVVSQVLLKKIDGKGRVPATEVLIANAAVSNLIREGKIAEVASVIQSGKAQGMHLLDDSLEILVQGQRVDPREAYFYASNKERFERFLPRMDVAYGNDSIGDRRPLRGGVSDAVDPLEIPKREPPRRESPRREPRREPPKRR